MAIPFPFGSLPANLKNIKQYLDIASDYETMDLSVSYWCRLYALQQGFTLQRGKEDLDYLIDLMEWLGGEELKSIKTVSDINEARVHVQNVALEFIKWADTGFQLFPINQFNKIVLGAFYSTKTLLDVCSVFGELTEEMVEKRKYIDLHLANIRNCQEIFSSEVTAGKTISVEEDSRAQKQWSPVGKNIYDREFLLELKNKPVSQILPEKLINEEIARGGPNKENISNEDHSSKTSTFAKKLPGFSKREQPKSNPMMRKRCEEDTRKRKNAFKFKGNIDKMAPNEVSIEEYLNHVAEILNELTPLTLAKVLPKIKALDLNTEERLSEVSKLLYEKAVDEPKLSLMYAKTCQALSLKKVTCVSNPTETITFRSMLLTRCLIEFDKASTGKYDLENKKKEIRCADTEAKKTELEIGLGELLKNRRKYGLANIRFIGELFKIKMIPIRVAHECVVWLLSQDEDEEALECLCLLLIATGKGLEKTKGVMTSYLSTLKTIANKAETSDRIRSLIRGVIDLRNVGWLSPENDAIKADKAPNEREEGLNNFQSPQDMGIGNGIFGNDGADGGDVDVIEESGDVDSTIESGDPKLLAKQLEESRDPREMIGMVEVCEDLYSLPLAEALNDAPKSTVDSVAIDKPLLSGSTTTSSDNSGAQETVLSEAVFQIRLEDYLKSATNRTIEDVFDWIQKEHVGEIDSVFIRVLTTCVLESSVEGNGPDSKLKMDVFKHWTALLGRYVNKIVDRELQTLFAVQAFVHKQNHPEYLIQNVFEILYYSDVVSELSLLSWMDSKDDVAGCQGKTEALKLSGSFLSWLVEDVVDCEEMTQN